MKNSTEFHSLIFYQTLPFEFKMNASEMESICFVVGPPGSGKSTLLQQLYNFRLEIPWICENQHLITRIDESSRTIHFLEFNTTKAMIGGSMCEIATMCIRRVVILCVNVNYPHWDIEVRKWHIAIGRLPGQYTVLLIGTKIDLRKPIDSVNVLCLGNSVAMRCGFLSYLEFIKFEVGGKYMRLREIYTSLRHLTFCFSNTEHPFYEFFQANKKAKDKEDLSEAEPEGKKLKMCPTYLVNECDNR